MKHGINTKHCVCGQQENTTPVGQWVLQIVWDAGVPHLSNWHFIYSIEVQIKMGESGEATDTVKVDSSGEDSEATGGLLIFLTLASIK